MKVMNNGDAIVPTEGYKRSKAEIARVDGIFFSQNQHGQPVAADVLMEYKGKTYILSVLTGHQAALEARLSASEDPETVEPAAPCWIVQGDEITATDIAAIRQTPFTALQSCLIEQIRSNEDGRD